MLTLFFAILQANASYDEPKTYRKQADFKIFFPVNNAVLYAEYKKNAILLDKITQIIDSISAKPNMHFIDFKVCGYSSPDGLESHNILLSIQRMKQIKNFMIKKYGIDPIFIDLVLNNNVHYTSTRTANYKSLHQVFPKIGQDIKENFSLIASMKSIRCIIF